MQSTFVFAILFGLLALGFALPAEPIQNAENDLLSVEPQTVQVEGAQRTARGYFGGYGHFGGFGYPHYHGHGYGGYGGYYGHGHGFGYPYGGYGYSHFGGYYH